MGRSGIAWLVSLGAVALAVLATGGTGGGPASAQSGEPPHRVFAVQAASTPTPVGARCNDQMFHGYTGPATCADHGGVHYWIYPGHR